MDITFDPAKRLVNLEKHSLDFWNVQDLDWDSALIVPDERHDYGEQRYAAFVYGNERLHHVSFTWREGLMRVISFRYAREKEKQRYGKT